MTISDEDYMALYAKVQRLAYLYEQALSRIESIEHQPVPENKLPFLERFPIPLMAIRMQMFENEGCQGVPRYKGKASVWDKPQDRDEAARKPWQNGR